MPTVQPVQPINYADLLMKGVGSYMQMSQMQQQQKQQDQAQEQKASDRAFQQSFGVASNMMGKLPEEQTTIAKNYLNYLEKTGQDSETTRGLVNALESGDPAQIQAARQSINQVFQSGINRGFTDPRAKGKQQQFSNVLQLRKEIQNRTKPFIEITDSYSRMLESEPTAQGDIAMIFNYMKMLDPGSVVRESEYATAANAAGVPSRIKVMWNKMIDGEKLSKEQRSKFISQAKAFYGGQKHRNDVMMDDYVDFGKRRGIPEDDIRIKYGEPRTKKQREEAQQQQEIQQQQPGALPENLLRPPPQQPQERQPPTRKGGNIRSRDLVNMPPPPEGVDPVEYERTYLQMMQGVTNGV